MKKVNNILKMISKMESNANEVKLGKHEVELALIDDLNKSLAEASKNEADYYSNFKSKLNSVIIEARETEIKYNVLLSNINEPIFQMEKQAKELGLDIKSTPVYKKSQDTIKAIEKRKEVIDSIINNIQKFGF
jgi:hypothetical protein